MIPSPYLAFAKGALALIGGIRAAIFLALAIAFLLSSTWYKSEALRVKADWAKANTAAIVAQARANQLAAELEQARAEVTVRVVTKYVDRVQVVQGRTRTIIKEVPVYVPADSADLPAGFRVLHDAAAQGELPDPARIADAAPVPAQDAASTVAENYGQCHAYVEQVIGLQDWIRAQQAVN